MRNRIAIFGRVQPFLPMAIVFILHQLRRPMTSTHRLLYRLLTTARHGADNFMRSFVPLSAVAVVDCGRLRSITASFDHRPKDCSVGNIHSKYLNCARCLTACSLLSDGSAPLARRDKRRGGEHTACAFRERRTPCVRLFREPRSSFESASPPRVPLESASPPRAPFESAAYPRARLSSAPSTLRAPPPRACVRFGSAAPTKPFQEIRPPPRTF